MAAHKVVEVKLGFQRSEFTLSVHASTTFHVAGSMLIGIGPADGRQGIRLNPRS